MRVFLFLLIIFLGLSNSVQTLAGVLNIHSNVVQIDEIFVEDNRKNGSVLSTAPMQEMNSYTLESANSLQLSDALKYFSGVTIKDYGGIGGLKTVSVRGLGACHTAVAIDGVLQTDIQTGQIDLGKILSSQIKTIRLVKGLENDILQPAVLSASATTLNMESDKPDMLSGKRKETNIKLKGGSFQTYNLSADFSAKISGKAMVSLYTEWLESGGEYGYTQLNGIYSKPMKRDNSDVQVIKTGLDCFYEINNSALLFVKSYFHQSERGLPSNILYNDNASERIWNRDWYIQTSLKNISTTKWKFLANTKFNFSRIIYHNNSVNNTTGEIKNRYIQKEGYISGVALYRPFNLLSVSLAEDIRISTLNSTTISLNNPIRYTLNSSLSAKLVFERVVFIGQLNNVTTKEYSDTGLTADNHNRLSPAIAANFNLIPQKGIHLRASIKEVYRLPTFNDLYFEQVGRRNLRPEKANMYNTGVIWDTEQSQSWKFPIQLLFSCDFFINYIEDKILSVPGKSTAIWMMQNVGEVVAKGAETFAEIGYLSKEGLGVHISLSYTYQRAMDKTNKNRITYNHQIPYTPRHSGSAIFSLKSKIVSVSYNMFFSGEYFSNSYNGPEYLMSGYQEHGLSLIKEFHIRSSQFVTKAELINLFDSRYELIRNYPMPGREFRLIMGINF